jgi:hypothetical protein
MGAATGVQVLAETALAEAFAYDGPMLIEAVL